MAAIGIYVLLAIGMVAFEIAIAIVSWLFKSFFYFCETIIDLIVSITLKILSPITYALGLTDMTQDDESC